MNVGSDRNTKKSNSKNNIILVINLFNGKPKQLNS